MIREIEAIVVKPSLSDPEITLYPGLAGTCAVWGHPHYFTFDNHYYHFQENCTFVLVKEIAARHNFTVHINNVLCDSSTIAVCSRSLFVYYKNYKVVLSVTKHPEHRTKVSVASANLQKQHYKQASANSHTTLYWSRCWSTAGVWSPPTQMMTSS